MEQKRRGRPPGTGKKAVNIEEKIKADIDTNVRKRGRTPKPKVEVQYISEVPLEGEVEGTVYEKLKNLAKQIQYMDHLLNQEPYRMDLRVKKTDTISRMCFLIESL